MLVECLESFTFSFTNFDSVLRKEHASKFNKGWQSVGVMIIGHDMKHFGSQNLNSTEVTTSSESKLFFAGAQQFLRLLIYSCAIYSISRVLSIGDLQSFSRGGWYVSFPVCSWYTLSSLHLSFHKSKIKRTYLHLD